MKQTLTLFLSLLFFTLTPLVHAQTGSLPGSATTEFSVLNISQGNKDATQVGVRPGDALKYELTINSDADDVQDYVARVDVSKILDQVQIIDVTKGKLQGSHIVFDPFSHEAPCKQVFAFYVRFKECNGMSSLQVNAEGKTTNVGTTCSGAPTKASTPPPTKTVKLPTTGPNLWIIVGIIGLIGFYGIFRAGSQYRS